MDPDTTWVLGLSTAEVAAKIALLEHLPIADLRAQLAETT
jgi:hypothetical protein